MFPCVERRASRSMRGMIERLNVDPVVLCQTVCEVDRPVLPQGCTPVVGSIPMDSQIVLMRLQLAW